MMEENLDTYFDDWEAVKQQLEGLDVSEIRQLISKATSIVLRQENDASTFIDPLDRAFVEFSKSDEYRTMLRTGMNPYYKF